MWYSGFLGTVTIRKKLKFASKSRDTAILDERSISQETTIVLGPSFMTKRYELRIMESFGHISRTLNVERVVAFGSPILKMASAGDMAGMYGAFCDGRASPDIVDPRGWGLLHVSNLLEVLDSATYVYYSTVYSILSSRRGMYLAA